MTVKKNIFRLFLLIASFSLLCAGCSLPGGPKRNVSFKVISKHRLLPSDNVYLTGNNKALGNWEASAVRMERKSDTTFIKTLSFNEGQSVEFKVTLGSWNSEALNADGWILDNS
ncbi:MAG TPA: CBM20 domain-containing protein, partial [Ignavibacteriales bacterium]|nr:CBM20 domain-containing protein [Ignavibacteriales bacterium]